MFSKSFVALLVLALTTSVNAVPVCDCILKRDSVLATTRKFSPLSQSRRTLLTSDLVSARQGCCQPIEPVPPISERAIDLDARQDTVLPRLCECILKRDAAPGAPRKSLLSHSRRTLLTSDLVFSRQCCTPDEPISPISESVVPTPVIDSLIPSKFLLMYEEDFAYL